MAETTWPDIRDALEELERDLRASETDNDIRAIGTKCRETLLSLARLVFDPGLHMPSGNDVPPGPSDAEVMLEFFVETTAAHAPQKLAHLFAVLFD